MRFVALILSVYYAPAFLERFLPQPALRQFQRRLGNPGGVLMSRMPGWAVVETIGRRSGQVRQVPVGGRLIDGSFWFVAVDPDHAGYVRNIEGNPHVRVKVGSVWRTGVARLLPDDNARRRMFQLNPLNGIYISIAGRSFLSVCVRLDG